MAQLNEFLRQWYSSDSHIEAHTSGSTGTPKRILLNKSDMSASAQATIRAFNITERSVLALPLSLDYIAGKMMAVRAETAHCTLLMLPQSNDIILPEQPVVIDLLAVVPSQLQSLLLHKDYAGRIKTVLVGGGAPSTEMCRALCDAGYTIMISYGMTETCSHVALAHGDDPQRIYHAMPGIRFEQDERQCLRIIAPHFTFGTLQTNDIVELIDSESFIYRGRADSVINSGGLKLVAEEIEALCAAVLPGRKFYITSRPHELWGQAACLVIEADASETDVIMQQLRTAIRDHRMLPKSIEAVASLPRTASGKIQRH